MFARMFAPVVVRGVQYTPRMLLRPAVLERERLLGAYGHWDITVPRDSGVYVLRDKLRAAQVGAPIRPSASDLRALGSSLRDLMALARGILVDGRRYYPANSAIHLRVDTEQLPDANSRITLTNEQDSLGLTRVAVDWRVSEVEMRTVRRAAELLGEELERRGVGTLEPAVDPFDSRVPWGELKGDSFHMMGGTRMARVPEEGVVDPNCRVVDTHNLYIAGASVFPTGGVANPTLTLIALTLRLADHLVSSS
jgi:choline dehydrogenase-like flavoprotein